MCGFCWTVPHTRSNGNSVAWLFLSTAHLKSDSAGILAKIGEGGKTWATVGSKNEQGATGSGVCTGWSWWKLRSCHCWVLLLPTHQRSAASFSSPCRLCHVLGIADPLLLLARAWWHVPWPCSQDTQGGCSIYGNYCVRLCRRVCVPSNFQGCKINFVAKAWSLTCSAGHLQTISRMECRVCCGCNNDN